MAKQYQDYGIRFSYPANWQVQEEHAEDRTSIDLTGPATATCSVVLLRDRPDPELVVDAVADALRDEYEDVDQYEIQEEIAQRAAVGRDVDFFCLEMCNSASVRAFPGGRFTVLLMCQANSDDLEAARDAFDRICATIDCDVGPALDG